MIKRRVGVLASGRGSNFTSLAEACRDPDFPATIAVLIANRADAPALGRARDMGIPALAVPHAGFGRDREAHERALDAALADEGANCVALAGYMRLFSPWMVRHWSGRMLNIHPSLLPAFPGLDTHRRALAAGAKLHGCTVHLVTETVDGGPILGQAAVPVLPGDDEAALAARVLAQEHRLYPAVLRGFCLGETAAPDASAALLNPLPARATAT